MYMSIMTADKYTIASGRVEIYHPGQAWLSLSQQWSATIISFVAYEQYPCAGC